MRALLTIIPLLLLGFAAGVSASAECTEAATDCVEVGKWQISMAVGAGVRTNPVLERKDIPLVVLPEVSYTGERFFIQNLDFGFILLENETHRLNIFATPSYDQVFFHRWNPNNFVMTTSLMASPTNPPVRQESANEGPPPTLLGADDTPPPTALGAEKAAPANQRSFNNPLLTPSNSVEDVTLGYKIVDMSQLHKRRMAGLAGFEYSVAFANWDLQAQWVYDVTDIHGGSEVRIALARHYRWDRHWLAFSLGANWQSDEVIDYYYGIRRDEVLAESVYYGKAGISSVARVDWRYDLNERWSLTLTGSYRQLADEISRSPIIEDDEVITGFIGGVYHF